MSLPKTPAVTLSEQIDVDSEYMIVVLTCVSAQTCDEVKTVNHCCGDEGKKMEASAESNRVAGALWRWRTS
jgi:hypothetical protein